MTSVDEIWTAVLARNVRFHKREESELFRNAVRAYLDKAYLTSANLSAVLYEKIFTTRLAYETANPEGFVPSKDNLQEQFTNLLQRESQIIESDRLSFRQITNQLVEAGVITTDEKNEYDEFYTKVRNPVAHGLTIRLFESMLGHVPSHTFEIDANYEAVYCKVAELLLDRIYDLMTKKVVRKQ
jgi:hypothetical protein